MSRSSLRCSRVTPVRVQALLPAGLRRVQQQQTQECERAAQQLTRLTDGARSAPRAPPARRRASLAVPRRHSRLLSTGAHVVLRPLVPCARPPVNARTSEKLTL